VDEKKGDSEEDVEARRVGGGRRGERVETARHAHAGEVCFIQGAFFLLAARSHPQKYRPPDVSREKDREEKPSVV